MSNLIRQLPNQLIRILAGCVLAGALSAQAADYTWTNSVNLSGYWTNNANWSPVGIPGAVAGDNAYLTNDVASAYTNVLDFTLGRTITTLAIANTLGEAWLIVTNAVLTNTNFTVGNGGRLEIDSGGVVTNISNFKWTGTTGAIYLNTGGKLFTPISGTGNFVISNYNGAAVTGLVTSASGPGNGGVWNFSGSNLILSNSFNSLSVSGGASLTNVGSLLVGPGAGAGFNSFSVTNGGRLFMNGAIYVGATPTGTGGPAGTGNNSVILSNSLVADTAFFIVGNGSSNNTVTLLNDTVVNANGTALILNIGIGAAVGNVVTLNGGVITNFAGGINLSGNQNSLIVTNGGKLFGRGNIVFNAANYGNTLTMGGGVYSNTLLSVGSGTGSSNNAFNLLGGLVTNVTGLTVGTASDANFNSVVVANGGRLVLNSGTILVGSALAGAAGGGNNTVSLSNSLLIANRAGFIGSGSSNNTVTLFTDTVWDNGGQNLTLGGNNNAATGNVLTVNGGTLTNINTLSVGNGTGNVNFGNLLIVANGGRLSTLSTTVIGQNGSSNNIFLIDGGSQALASSTVVSNGGLLTIGAANSAGNSLRVSNATVFSAGLTIGTGSSNNTATVLANATWNLGAGALTLGTGTGNVLTIDGGTVTNSGALALNGNQNSIVVGNGGQLFGKGAITFGTTGSGNSITLGGGLWDLNTNALTVGGAANSSNNTFNILGGIVSNAGPSVAGGLRVGVAQGANFNSVVVTNGGRFVMVDGSVLIGSGGSTAPGGNNNTVIISNSALKTGGLINNFAAIGVGSSNNTLTLLANTVWDNASQDLVIGGDNNNPGVAGNRSFNNVLNVNGAVVSNAGYVVIGGNKFGGALVAISNRVNVSNGGVISNVTGLIVGGGTAVVGSDYNSLIVTGGSSGFFMTAAGPILVGATTASAAAGSFNTVILSNSALWGTVANIGAGSSNNSVTLLPNTVWNNNGNALSLGAGGGSDNVLRVSGALLTNFSQINIGTFGKAFNNQLVVENGAILSNIGALIVGSVQGANFNTVTITNGGRLIMSTNNVLNNGVFVGSTGGQGAGGNNNTVIISNSVLMSSAGGGGGTVQVGWGSSNNTLTLLANTVWDNNIVNQGISVGGNVNGSSSYSEQAAGNVLNVNGAIISNAGIVAIGYAAGGIPTAFVGISNQVNVFNGGVISNVTSLSIGGRPAGGVGSSDFNSLIVTGGGGFFMTSAGSINVGATGNTVGGGNNTLILSNSSILGTGGSFIGVGSSNNTVILFPYTTWNNGAAGLSIGLNAAVSNSLTIHGGIISNISTLTVGSGVGGNNNSVFIDSDGLLQANTLAIGGGTGNTISNRNATYQFTIASPTITTNSGIIAITAGTISFRGINTADVTNNLGKGALSSITFAGANTFQLNAASNTTAGQTYTFQSVAGNPSNYVNLVMANGATAYRGGNLTIGQTGSLLISNTSASITGLFTNQGQALLFGSVAGFASNVVNGGLLSLQNATLTGAVTNLATGTLRGNGLIVGDVTSFGTNSPGFSVGTFSITGNLTLASSAVTWMELAGAGTNDQFIVSGLMTYGGQLIVTNITGFAYAYGQSFQLFQFGSHTGTFSVTNLPDLTAFSLEWNTAQLDTTGLLIIVPEPSTILLVVCGGLALWVLRRRALRD